MSKVLSVTSEVPSQPRPPPCTNNPGRPQPPFHCASPCCHSVSDFPIFLVIRFLPATVVSVEEGYCDNVCVCKVGSAWHGVSVRAISAVIFVHMGSWWLAVDLNIPAGLGGKVLALLRPLDLESLTQGQQPQQSAQ